jgi:class 3 adenylate cyclase/tetratricopeptide (TPR) repeat protein
MNSRGITVEPQQRKSGPAAAPERRYLTIVFSDLTDYTGLSERLDPEDLLEVQQKYQNLALGIVERYGGFVSRLSGDGILIYFGYPVAHENDAERAVRASLDLVQALKDLDPDVPGDPGFRLNVRLGVHTGPVLIGPEFASGGVVEHAVVGKAVNLASRLQTMAPTNSILVSSDTLELVEGLFDSTFLGELDIRGLSEQVAVHRILRARPSTPRSSARFRRGAKQVVGRDRLLERMNRHWAEVQATATRRLVWVIGEAGLGKTRLSMELCRHAELNGGRVVQVNCHELFARTPLYAVAGALWTQVGLQSDDDEKARATKIETFLARFGLATKANVETANSLFEILGGVASARQALPVLTKQRRFDLLLALLREVAGKTPLLLWIEDAHWLDPSSAELLADLWSRIGEAPILFLATARPLPHDLPLPAPDEVLELEPLSEAECRDLAHSMPDSDALPAELVDRAIGLADGNPLFVEQLMLSLIDNQGGATRPTGREEVLPLTLAEMMSERLDRLPGGRRIVQMSACLGRSFTPKSLAHLLGDPDVHQTDVLDQLVKADILRVQEDAAEPSYEFCHALLQRAAHDSMVQSERRATHARIADMLASDETGPPIPEVYAHHLTAAGAIRRAVDAWLRAGQSAGRRSAYVEAIAHIERGLELVDQVADQSERDALEKSLQAALIGPLTAIGDQTADRMLQCCQRGLQLCKEGPPSPLIFAFLFGQFSHAICSGNGELTLSSAELFQSAAIKVNSESGQVVGHRLLGSVHLGRADIARATKELKASLDLYRPERDQAALQMFGQNIQVHSLSILCLALLYVGEVEEALRFGIDALNSIDELQDPHSSALALGYVGGWVFGMCGALEQQRHAVARLEALASQHRLRNVRLFAEGFTGWILCRSGELERGIAMLEKAVGELEAVNFALSLPGYMAVLADNLRRAKRYHDAEDLCQRASKLIARSGQRLYEPELKRLCGMVAADARGHVDEEVRAMLQSAIDRAQELRLPLVEVRAWRTLQRYVGYERLGAHGNQRLKELAFLNDLEDRAARLIRANYPLTA